MRRTVFLSAVVAVIMVAAASGAALADNIEGNGGNNRLVGTNGRDTISGGGGADRMFGRGGHDRLFGDAGNDVAYGGNGNDRLQSGLGRDRLFGQTGNDFANAIDGQTNDLVDCGPGAADVAGVDFTGLQDRVAANCEDVYFATGPYDAGELGFLSRVDSRREAEAAEANELLTQLR